VSDASAARDTIFALSSGALPAAIAIVRVSGPAAGTVLQKVAGRMPAPRRAAATALHDETGALLDCAMILWLPGPATATGEDMAELHLHGGRAVVAAVLDRLAREPGLRAAEPGEFTRRAFVNGRMGLDEAEGLAELLAATTEGQRRQAMRRAEGGLGRLAEQWREEILLLAAHVEAALQFGEDEEDVPPLGPEQHKHLEVVTQALNAALQQPPAERLNDGIRVVLAGPPNVGKSSLLNALTGYDSAIVSPIAGTTRDIIDVPVDMGGLPFLFRDTAGLHDSDDPIERIGIDRAEGALETADIVLWLGSATDTPQAPRVIVVHSAVDRSDRAEVPPNADVATSVIDGSGLDRLRSLLLTAANTLIPGESMVAINLRQRTVIHDAACALSAVSEERDAVLVAEGLRRARVKLDQLVGRASVDDLLDTVFGAFCIGK
jgi:tRNA modification GTPase